MLTHNTKQTRVFASSVIICKRDRIFYGMRFDPKYCILFEVAVLKDFKSKGSKSKRPKNKKAQMQKELLYSVRVTFSLVIKCCAYHTGANSINQNI